MDVTASIFFWWLVFFLGGLTALPLCARLFPTAADHGYPFAKILALLILAYPVWLLGSLHLLPFAASPVWLLLTPSASIIAISLILPKLCHPRQPRLASGEAGASGDPVPLDSRFHGNDNITFRFSPTVPLIIVEEIIFTLTFFFWLFVRSHEPSLQSLEKPMDFGIINSILRADYFPPKDMWLAGYSLNYYYFGHLVTAVLIKITGVLPAVGYNLMLATLFALTFTAAFSFGLNLIQNSPLRKTLAVISIIIGLLTAATLTLFGNLHPVFAFLNGFGSYWYPDATRFIPRTIHEFPLYSFVVADLHAHVLDIPFVLLTIFTIYQAWRHLTPLHDVPNPSLRLPDLSVIAIRQLAEKQSGSADPSRGSRGISIVAGLPRLTVLHNRTVQLAMTPKIQPLCLLGFLLGILYIVNSLDAVIYFALFALLLSTSYWTQNRPLLKFREVTFWFNTLEYYTKRLLPVVIIIILTSLPFLLSFKPFVGGLGLAPERSPFWQLFILWGGFLPLALGFLFYCLRRLPETLRVYGNPKGLISNDAFVALLSLFALLLILVPEFFYFRDIYTTQPRANTMFKFTYQAFILLSLATPYAAYRLLSLAQSLSIRLFWTVVYGTVLIITGSYPFFAIRGYYGNFQNPPSLNGLTYLDRMSPGDYQAVNWLNKNIMGQPVILEAVGESYTGFARISAGTGLPTVFGWPVHEWLWRSSNRYAEERRPDVEQIYTLQDINETLRLLEKYQVKYVTIGDLERSKYAVAGDKFNRIGKPVFTWGQTIIYQVSD